jgi:hypothetical protein
MDEIDNELKPREMEYYVYLDSIGISRKILYIPEIWGIRTQDEQRTEWSKDKNIVLNMNNPSITKVAICSTGETDVFINGSHFRFCKGKNELEYLPLIEPIRRKSELIITDDRYTEKIVLACNPECRSSELVIDKNVDVAISYAGPEMQKITIRTFVDGFKSSQIEKTASKSKATFYVLVGEALKVKGKRVVVDICTSKSGIPTKIFDQIIEINASEEIKETTAGIENNRVVSCVSDYVNVNNLLEYYYEKTNSRKSVDLAKILEWIKEAK